MPSEAPNWERRAKSPPCLRRDWLDQPLSLRQFRTPAAADFSADRGMFTEVDREGMVQFPPLGLEVPEDHPDRNRYSSAGFRQREARQFQVVYLMCTCWVPPGRLSY